MSNTDTIYMAGLMDGEGTIGITYYTNKLFRSPYISITTTTPEIADWLKETYGGLICQQKVYKDHHKPSWSWRLTNKEKIFSLLSAILPYMKEPDKVRRGNLLLDEYDSVTLRNGKYSEEQRARKLDYESRFLAR